tara:strand:- start:65 stop:529 length:465 start_codon:yes stop_codon:yes gene_type:complete
MINIDVIVKEKKWFKFLKNPENYLKKKIKKIQNDKFFKNNIKFNFCILLSNSNSIKLLNKKFRKKNKSTDVLSFPSYEKKKLDKIIKKEKEIYLGDIIINYSKLKKNSKKKQFIKHLDKLWVHALLHLFGHKHRKNLDFKRMSILEKKFLNKLA